MLSVVSIESPAWKSRCHVVVNSGTVSCLVVDPGNFDIAQIEQVFVDQEITRCDYILLTHEHFDHIAGAEVLKNKTGAQMIASRACAAACRDVRENMSFYLDGKGFSLGAVDWVCEERGWTIPWEGHRIEMAPCPGHSPGGILIRLNRFLFTGDSLLATGPGPTHLPGGNKAQLALSLEGLRRKYPGEMMVYPGHGEAFPLSGGMGRGQQPEQPFCRRGRERNAGQGGAIGQLNSE